MRPDTGRNIEFVYTPLFESAARVMFDDEAMRHVELALLVAPRAGDLVPGTGGVRKLRAQLPGQGKRGGARVIYLYIEIRDRVYFLLAYAKNEQVDLTATQKQALRTMAKQLEELE